MIEAVHVLDRQAGGVQMGVVRQENGCNVAIGTGPPLNDACNF